jgi:tetratricopeptide (TPR) repeat protein
MKESVETREAIRKEEPRDPENLRGLALADESISGILFDPEGIALGREREALPLMEESIRLFRELMDEDPRNASAREDLALNLPQLAELEPHRAASLLHESLSLFESLPPTFAGRDRHIGLILCDLASLQRRENRLAEARASLAEAERKYARENPADPLARGDFLVLWNQQAEFALRTGDSKAAVAAWMRVWNALSPFPAAAREDMSAAFQMAVCARNLSRAFVQSSDAAEAARWQVKSAEVWQGWKGRYPAADRQLD